MTSNKKAKTKRRRGRPRTLDPKVSKGARTGLKEGYNRVTMILRDDHAKDLKDLARQANLPMKSVMEIILGTFLKSASLKRKVLKKGFKEGEFWTVDELADLVGLTPVTIRYYVSAGTIPAKKIGNEWVIEKNRKTGEAIMYFCKEHGDRSQIDRIHSTLAVLNIAQVTHGLGKSEDSK